MNPDRLTKPQLIVRLKDLAESCRRGKNESHGQDEVYYRAKEQAFKKAMELAKLLDEDPVFQQEGVEK